MKDKILEIMQKTDKVNENKHYLPPDKRQKISAKLIADMIQKFVEWTVFSKPDFVRDENGNLIADQFSWLSTNSAVYTLDELFAYWHKNIYKIKDKEK